MKSLSTHPEVVEKLKEKYDKVRMAMDGNFREENLLFKLLKSDKRLWIFAIMVALIGTINAEQKADDTQPFKATKAVEAPSTSTAKDFSR